MKKRTKAQKIKDCFDAFKCIKENRKVKREGTKDGSIATHPVVPVPDELEAVVLKDCLKWLKAHGIFANRHDSGSFQNNSGQWGTYGIKNSGDIHGLTKQGIHFELECKRGKGGRLSLGQQERMRDVRDNNGIYFVIHGVQELEHYYHLLRGF